jgi:hypothetical protein
VSVRRLLEACAEAGEKVQRDWMRRSVKLRLFSRGRWLAFTVRDAAGKEIAVFEGETRRWAGNRKDLLQAVRVAAARGTVLHGSIFCGYDAAASPVARFHGEYDPLVEEWEVDIPPDLLGELVKEAQS